MNLNAIVGYPHCGIAGVALGQRGRRAGLGLSAEDRLPEQVRGNRHGLRLVGDLLDEPGSPDGPSDLRPLPRVGWGFDCLRACPLFLQLRVGPRPSRNQVETAARALFRRASFLPAFVKPGAVLTSMGFFRDYRGGRGRLKSAPRIANLRKNPGTGGHAKTPSRRPSPRFSPGSERTPMQPRSRCLIGLANRDPRRFSSGQLRTPQRRLEEWRQVMARELVFACQNSEDDDLVLACR